MKNTVYSLTLVMFMGTALVPTTGCSDPGSELTGTVTFNGKPLTGGKVTFFHPTQPGRNVSAYIQPNGSYKILAVPRGDNKVTVVALPPRKKDRTGKEAKGRMKVPPVPEKYTDPATTTLVVTVTSGSQSHDFNIQPES